MRHVVYNKRICACITSSDRIAIVRTDVHLALSLTASQAGTCEIHGAVASRNTADSVKIEELSANAEGT